MQRNAEYGLFTHDDAFQKFFVLSVFYHCLYKPWTLMGELTGYQVPLSVTHYVMFIQIKNFLLVLSGVPFGNIIIE